MRPLLRRSPASTVAALATSVLIIASIPASAGTRADLNAAKQRLQILESKMAAERAALTSMQSALNAAAARVDRTSTLFEQIQVQVILSRRARERVQARYETIRAHINKIAVDLYIRIPTGSPTSLRTGSMSDAIAAEEYARAIISADQARAEEAQRIAFDLRQKQAREDAVMAQRATLLRQFEVDQQDLQGRVDEQRRQLIELSATRAEASALLNRLRAKLRAEELAAARAALGGGMTFGNWAKAFLGHLHAPISKENLIAVVAWEVQEFTQAKWNPLATTHRMPGSTSYNGAGVQNYTSLQQGLTATEHTLRNPGLGYEQILIDLARAADAMDTAHAIAASRWCGCGDRYVVHLIPSVRKYYRSYADAHA